ncbi:MAG: extracellular solute-binding protein [Clostridia bacterium]|nr:extracellular solute-binding protein [Clostridia bacterium]
MKHDSAKLLSLALAVVMLLSSLLTLVSCGVGDKDSEDPDSTLSTSADGTAAEGEGTRPLQYPNIEKTNFDREFVICARDDMKEEFDVTDLERGEILTDLLYERNLVVTEDFGIELKVIDGGDYNTVNATIQNQVTANDDEYDMFTGHKVSFMNCAQQGYLYDLNEIDTIHPDAPYWDQGCRENLSLMGHNYMLTGDIDPASMLISSCFVFNKQLNTELGKTEPYELVDNGDWTLDAYLSQVKDVSQDLNSDGSMNYADDRFSNTIWSLDGAFSMFYGAGGMFITINSETLEPELTYDSERVIDIYSKLYSAVVTENAFWLPRTEIANYGINYSIFTEGRALYCDITLSKISSFLADMESDYGIVPVPKYDKAQPEYLSFVNGASPFVMISQTEKDPEFVGTIVEAMAAYNYDNVTPKMFEIVTKLQSARDPDSSRMVDYIIRNRVYDFGYYLDMDITNVVMEGLSNQKETIASDLKKNDSQAKGAIKRLIKKLEKNEG